MYSVHSPDSSGFLEGILSKFATDTSFPTLLFFCPLANSNLNSMRKHVNLMEQLPPLGFAFVHGVVTLPAASCPPRCLPGFPLRPATSAVTGRRSERGVDALVALVPVDVEGLAPQAQARVLERAGGLLCSSSCIIRNAPPRRCYSRRAPVLKWLAKFLAQELL